MRWTGRRRRVAVDSECQTGYGVISETSGSRLYYRAAHETAARYISCFKMTGLILWPAACVHACLPIYIHAHG